MSTDLSRRKFIAGASALTGLTCLGGCHQKTDTRWTGSIVGAAVAAGHRLRAGNFPEPSETREVEAVVLGSGISGLSAARALHRAGVADLLVLELESQVGGNAQGGRNAVSAFPWGAHYLPLPGEESPEVAAFLDEIGLVTGHTADGTPIYDEYALCSDPMERLFVNGKWQEGMIPRLDNSVEDQRQLENFFVRMDQFRARRGSDGRRAFAIPLDRSSQDPDLRALDRITMAEYLRREGWTAEPLYWYVNYCCRDDYGAGCAEVSAWAGIHYFASRNGRAANAAPYAVLTWPEGNGYLVERLRAAITSRVVTGALVWRIIPRDNGVEVDYLELARERTVRVRARGAICALPRFVAQHLIRTEEPSRKSELIYSPWMVANLTVKRTESLREIAWDNVLRASESLGYVDATHQTVSSHPGDLVLTYYQPLDAQRPAEARQSALARSYQEWCEQILADLSPAHPDLRGAVRQIDIWLWGHAMIRPVPGFIWGSTRQAMQSPIGRLHFAHSDMSGISIFEEAFIRGQHAARELSAALRSSPT